MSRVIFGASSGFFLAMCLISVALFVGVNVTGIPNTEITIPPYESMPWQEWYENLLYKIAFPIAIGGAVAAHRFGRRVPSTIYFLASSLAILGSVAIGRGFFEFTRFSPSGLALGCIAASLVVFWPKNNIVACNSLQLLPRNSNLTSSRVEALYFVAFLLLVVLLLKPISITDMSTWMTDPHTASYLVAPALNLLSDSAKIGYDFEAHYGLGVPYLFSWILGSTLEQSTFRSTIFVLILTISFYIQFYLLSRWIFGYASVAIFLSTFILIAGFDGFSLAAPSSLPARFAAIPALVWACIAAADRGAPIWRSGLAGAIAGLALVYQTDTGLMALLSAGAFFGAIVVFGGRNVLILFAYMSAAGFAFLFALTIMTGFGMHLLIVPMRMIEPLLLYSSGFGGLELQWSNTWAIFYNVGMPTLLTASIGLALMRVSSNNRTDSGRKTYALLILSLFGYIALLKWVNRSIDIIWWLNGWAALLVLAIWLEIGFQWIAQRLALDRWQHFSFASIFVLAICALTFIDYGRTIIHGLPRSPAVRWSSYFWNHPSLAQRIILYAATGKFNRNSDQLPRPVAASDSAFIRDRTDYNEPIVVLSKNDWLYLQDIKRPSAMYWMPTYLTHSKLLTERNLDVIRKSRRLFFDKEIPSSTGYWIASMKTYPMYWKIDALLAECFVEQEKTERWSLMTNRCVGPSDR